MKLTNKCSYCGKTLEIVKECRFTDTQKIVSYTCGHSVVELLEVHKNLSLSNVHNDKHARHYQVDGVDFIVNGRPGNDSGFNCLLGDQQRIGKTPQALMAAASDRSKKPVLCIVGGANVWQWWREVKDWYSILPLGVYVISGTNSFIPPGFDVYLISRDTFSSSGTCKNCKHALRFHDKVTDECGRCEKLKTKCPKMEHAGDSMAARLLEFGFKLCIVDECHNFKNTDSQRSKALISFLKEINQADLEQDIPFNCMICKHQWIEHITVKVDGGENVQKTSKSSHCPNCQAVVTQSAAAHIKVSRKCGVIMLSGTAIKNRADELFVPLNIVAPERFPTMARFRNEWLTQDDKGKYSRVKEYKFEEFKKVIAPFYLRREKEDIYTDLPKMNRMFTVIKIEDEKLKKAYNSILDKMEAEMVSRANYSYFDSIGDLMILRQLCGIAKVKWVTNYVDEMFEDSDTAKVAIGYHHYSVRERLKDELGDFGVVKLDGQDSPEQKDYIAHKYFEKAPERVMILGMMAAKEGMELVYLDKAIVLEREFTAADEEQFEYRFYNPDKDYLRKRGLNPEKSTEIEYVVAQGTIDEWFYELVESKRAIFGETLGTNWNVMQDPGSFKDLVMKTIGGRL